MTVLVRAICVGAIGFFASIGAALAQQDAADYYKGKTVTFIVSAGAGGGYDTYGRLLTRYLPKYMPGTRFLVRNVPGAGHIVGANTIYAARPDGLTIGTFVTGLIYTQLLETSGVRFDLAKMSWIGQMAEEGRSLIVSKISGITTVPELLKPRPQPLLFATSGIGSSNHIEARIMMYALDINAKLVPNMQENEAELSMIRGEVQGVVGSASSLGDFVRNGHGKFLMGIAGERSAVAGAPQIREFVKRQDSVIMLDMVETMAELGRIVAGPPGIPADRLDVLRRAFDKALRDPGLIADAKRIQVPIEPDTGEAVDGKVKRLLSQPPTLVALMRKIGANK